MSPQRDKHHQAVKNALIHDGWTITHDPLTLSFGFHNLYVDLGAERLIAAERNTERIAVEVKTFAGPSDVADLEMAVGQYVVYRTILADREPQRGLVLAVPSEAFEGIFESALGKAVRIACGLMVLVFDPEQERIRQWLK